MGNALALAGVMATLKDLLDDGLTNGSVGALAPIEVSLSPPDQIVGDEEKNQLNLYLWKVSHNPAFANDRLPSHSSQGARVSNPRLGLDLHVILTATGENDLNAAILLGYGMQQLHEHPNLTPQDIRDALQIGAPPVDGSILPTPYKLLAASDLADQFEYVRIQPTKSEEEDLFKLWPAFNASLRMSALYKVSVVLIEASREVSKGPPVRGFNLIPEILNRPEISRVVAQPGPIGADLQPNMQPQAGSRVALLGHGLVTEHMKIFIGGQEVDVQVGAELAAQRLSILLPSDVGAGLHLALVEHYWQAPSGDLRRKETSRGAAVLVAPTVTNIAQTGSAVGGLFTGVLTIDLANPVGVAQSARLYLDPENAANPPAAITAAPLAADGTRLTFSLSDVPEGVYQWQLSIDGAETMPEAITFGGP